MKELEELQEKIEETGDIATAQQELNKKREAELSQLRADFQAQSEENDRTVAELKKKHHGAVEELQEQVGGASGGRGERLLRERREGKRQVGLMRHICTGSVREMSGLFRP